MTAHEPRSTGRVWGGLGALPGTLVSVLAAASLSCGGAVGCASDAADVYASVARVVSFTPGQGAGYGQDQLPRIILGAPRGEGLERGSLDTLSFGRGGELVVELSRDVHDEPGIDFVVFENAFVVAGGSGRIYTEPGYVEVSPDGTTFTAFPCDPATEPYSGCAGLAPVFANADRSIPADDLEAAGGDRFDLANVGLGSFRFVRIRDGGMIPSLGGGKDGFDLDAIVGLH